MNGIRVCFGTILGFDVGEASSTAGRKEELKNALEAMGAKCSERIQIDAIHVVCATPLPPASVSASAGVHSSAGGPRRVLQGEELGVEYHKAIQLSIPIIWPDWVLACYCRKRMVPTRPHSLGTPIPPLVQVHDFVQSISQRQLSQPHPPLPPTTPMTSSTPASQDSDAPPPWPPARNFPPTIQGYRPPDPPRQTSSRPRTTRQTLLTQPSLPSLSARPGT